ncbi:MAG: Crp/Fnr family transcriptional regulator [Variibacter sp.]|nr:Crp/Fnr family transcriptional regulator [Variibacter sp.]
MAELVHSVAERRAVSIVSERDGAEPVCEYDPIDIRDLIGILQRLPSPCQRKAGEQVLNPADEARTVLYVTSGWAFTYRLLDDGRRQILNIHLPGNIIGLGAIGRDVAAWGVEALTDLSYIALSRDALMARASGKPEIVLRLTLEAARGEILVCERLADVARRSARVRVANLLFELYCRSTVLDGGPQPVSIPLTQDEIADAVGLTPIHVSRTLRAFKADGIIRYVGHDLQIIDAANLKRISTFDEPYIRWLHRPTFKVRAGRQPLRRSVG